MRDRSKVGDGRGLTEKREGEKDRARAREEREREIDGKEREREGVRKKSRRNDFIHSYLKNLSCQLATVN